MAQTRIWTNYPPVVEDASLLRRLLPDYSILVGTKSGDDPSLEQVDVAFGQPSPEQAIRLANLRWIHVNTAGYTAYDRDDLREALRSRRAMFSNSSHVYCEPCAQHVLSLILSLARNIPQSVLNQHGPRAWVMNDLRGQSTLLNGQTALLVGFGAIGQRLAQLLAPLHMRLIAVRKNVRGDEPIETHPISNVDDLLPQADHVVNVLPASNSTRGLFSKHRFALMKPAAIFYNIGRGDTVDQEALQEALGNHHLSAAFLDVMTPEPLAPDHPLWTTPNCYISPHTAGGHRNEVERVINHFVENLRRFERGEKLVDQII